MPDLNLAQVSTNCNNKPIIVADDNLIEPLRNLGFPVSRFSDPYMDQKPEKYQIIIITIDSNDGATRTRINQMEFEYPDLVTVKLPSNWFESGKPINEQRLTLINFINEALNIANRNTLFGQLPTLSDLAALDINIEYLLEGLIPAGAITVLYGKGGIAKSTLMMHIGACIAEGNPFVGLMAKKTPVVYLDYDNPLVVIAEKARQLDSSSNFRYWSAAACGNNSAPPIIGDDSLTDLKLLPSGSLLIFDTFKAAQRKDLNSDNDMNDIMRQFRRLRDSGFTIVLLHHTPKNSDTPKNSGTITDNADHVLALKALEGSSTQSKLLFFGTDADDKSRYPKSFIHLHFDGISFDRAGAIRRNIVDDIKLCMLDLIQSSKTPNQSAIVEVARAKYSYSRSKVHEVLQSGEGKHWRQLKNRKNNSKIYELINFLSPIYEVEDVEDIVTEGLINTVS